MSFSKQIFLFFCVWALLIYVFLTKLNTSPSSHESEEIERLNLALAHLEKSKSVDAELKKLLDEYLNDVANTEQKREALRKINSMMSPTLAGGEMMNKFKC
jgi:hypothetical protein